MLPATRNAFLVSVWLPVADSRVPGSVVVTRAVVANDSSRESELPSAQQLTSAQAPVSVRWNAPDERARCATPLNALLALVHDALRSPVFWRLSARHPSSLLPFHAPLAGGCARTQRDVWGAATLRRTAWPSKGQWRWLAWSILRRVCLLERGASPHERTPQPVSMGIFLPARLPLPPRSFLVLARFLPLDRDNPLSFYPQLHGAFASELVITHVTDQWKNIRAVNRQ